MVRLFLQQLGLCRHKDYPLAGTADYDRLGIQSIVVRDGMGKPAPVRNKNM